MTGTPAFRMMFFAKILSPIWDIILEVGPINTMPDDSQMSANWAFSARKP